MNEEEALEIFKNLILLPYYWKITDKYKGTINFIGAMEGNEAIQIISNLIKKLQKENEELNNRCRNLDKEAQAYLEELAGDNTLTRRTIKQLQEENEECKLDVQDYLKQAQENAEMYRKAQKKIQDLKAENEELKAFKKQVTDIESTNFIKYKNYIPKSLVEEKIEEYKACGIEEGDYHIFQEEINALQDLLERSREDE